MKRLSFYIYLILLLIPLASKAASVIINTPFNDTAFCAGDSMLVRFTVSGGTIPPGNIMTVTLSDAAGNFSPSSPVIGTLITSQSDTVRCMIPALTPAGQFYKVKLSASDPINVTSPPSVQPSLGGIHIYRFAVLPTASSNSPVCEGTTLNLTSNYTDAVLGVSAIWIGPNSFFSPDRNPVVSNATLGNNGRYIMVANIGKCYHNDTVDVVVNPKPPLKSITTNQPLCEKDSLLFFLTDTTGVPEITYKWYGPDNFYDTVKNPILRHITVNNSGHYTVSAMWGNCNATLGTDVTVNKRPASPVVTANSPLRPGQNLQLNATSDGTPGIVYTWSGPDTFTSTEQNPVVKNVNYKSEGMYVVTAALGNCVSYGETVVQVLSGDVVIFPSPTNGIFTLSAAVSVDQYVPFDVINDAGAVMYRSGAYTLNKVLYTTVTLPPALANGTYTLRVSADGNVRLIPFLMYR